VIYTSQGAMTLADLEEHRRDTDWHELRPPVSQDGECDHARLLTDDCERCGRY
jgi:hypothetical protein